jgi:hypothetical protein
LIVGTALDSPTFREAWGEYEQHRAEGRNKLTPTARKQAVKKLLPIGSRRAVDAIRHSIGNGWRGIFEPKAPGGGGPSSFTPAAAPPGTYANVGKQY